MNEQESSPVDAKMAYDLRTDGDGILSVFLVLDLAEMSLEEVLWPVEMMMEELEYIIQETFVYPRLLVMAKRLAIREMLKAREEERKRRTITR